MVLLLVVATTPLAPALFVCVITAFAVTLALLANVNTVKGVSYTTIFVSPVLAVNAVVPDPVLFNVPLNTLSGIGMSFLSTT